MSKTVHPPFEELDYCPFCGGDGSEVVVIEQYVHKERRTMYRAVCSGCDSCGPWAGSEEHAYEWWNLRWTPPKNKDRANEGL